MQNNKKILMVAAENDALPRAKVGGVGDVIRDAPKALIKQGCEVDVVLPSYGFLARLEGAVLITSYAVIFGGKIYEISLLHYQEKGSKVNNIILHHPEFAPKGEKVYCNDPDWQPFATDATKFALFCAAVAQGLKIGAIARPDVIHCHDWHAAFLLILLKYAAQYKDLLGIHTVYTIHNLAMQGVRPLKGDESSFAQWFPELAYDAEMICDARFKDCVNPMRAGILLADKVHTVSPTYAEEIQHPSQYSQGIYGGEGLQHELSIRAQNGDLVGILNGCEYPKGAKYTKPSRKKIGEMIDTALLKWAAESTHLASAHWIAERRTKDWLAKKNAGFTMLSIGRVTEQKSRILQTKVSRGRTALEVILNRLGDEGTYIMLGNGDSKLESFFTKMSAVHDNFIFLNGYSDALSQELYKFGDLFLMPSSFEPCGISQMLAMRAGQPCLVNQVGGLKDTVTHTKNGFAFSGNNIFEQAENLVGIFDEALNLYQNNNVIYASLCKAAAKARFTWEESVKAYLERIY
ncbi:glycogen/starch synthase [Teredinibacter sp. KSP-S5-2]|uniref:glycogen synthase n=1 Tax=Teredinibacter sp. KSP-S5-2 TaxID=3034506 RepID=UPI002934AC2E|nr:glycogen/starch synthase [Teredinibacter sp. KSP-S5-2]WNO09736.1 glycogen/starch synthase [Teredinibacter sp. KSP-S5-2]